MTKSRLPFLLLLAAVLASLPLVLGFLGPLHPFFDAFSHLRVHLSVLMALLALPLLFTPLRREGAMVLLLAITAFGTTFSGTSALFGATAGAQTQAAPGARYSLVQINLRYDNPHPKRVLRMIAQEKPDIVTYEEAGDEWNRWLDILKGRYPYRLHCRKDSDPHIDGVGILSRRPFSDGSKPTCVGDGLLAMAAVDFGGTSVNVAALHSPLPWPYGQSQALDTAASQLQPLKGPTIIAGDFNAVPWSAAVRRIEATTGTHAIRGIGGSWFPFFLPVKWAPVLGFHIDQIFVDSDILAPKAATREDAGSDHLPVRLDFSVPPPVRPDEDQPQRQQAMAQ